MNADAAQWVGRRYALAGRPLSACPFDANGDPEQRVFAARFVQGYLDAEPNDDLEEDEDVEDELDDEALDALAADAEALEAELDEDEAERSVYPDNDSILRAMDPDGEEFRKYWTRGKGLRKWLGRPREWTALKNHLRKYVGEERAKRIASQWFHLVKGFWPGSDLHRVEKGKPPRGSRVGPG